MDTVQQDAFATLGLAEVTYNFLRTLTAEWRPDRKEGTARPGMIRVVETRNTLEEPCPNPLYP